MFRAIIQEILLAEDLKNFIKRTEDINYVIDSSNPTFEFEVEKKKKARLIKTIWSEEADHAFMKSLIKIHWISASRKSEKLQNFFTLKKNNEVSAMGYLPGATLESTWGNIGVKIEGRVTLAGNNMNAIMSGYGGKISKDIQKKYSSSGTPKRASAFTRDHAATYILDRDSFNEEESWQVNNELIVANWRIVGFVLSDFEDDTVYEKDVLSKILKLSKMFKLPVIDKNSYHISNEEIINYMDNL